MTTATAVQFPVLNQSNAPADAVPVLDNVQKAYGFLPNLIGTMASAPPLAEAYVNVSGLFGKTSFNATEQQIVLLTASFENNCTYCVAAHSAIAGMQKVPADVIESLRSGTPIADAKLEALRNLTREVVTNLGNPSTEAVDTFLSAGYQPSQILEVVLGVAQKILSNYTNHIAETPLDDRFQGTAWTKPV